jgi:signal transduction histidine kinase
MNSLAGRLLLAFVSVTALSGALTVLLATRSTSSEIRHVMTMSREGGMEMIDTAVLRDRLARSYASSGDWREAESLVGAAGDHMRMMGGATLLADPDGRILAGGPDGRLTAVQRAQALSIEVEGQLVGLLWARGVMHGMDPVAEETVRRVNRSVLLASLFATVVALGLSLLFVRTLGGSLSRIAGAAERVAGGEFDVRVPVDGPDEMRVLAGAFNQMTASLERQEGLRRSMLDDIAHDLRTPLTVIRAQVEAIVDGILPPTPEQLEPLAVQVQQVSHLVDDLRTLSNVEAGRLHLSRGPVALRDLVDDLLGAMVVESSAPGRCAHNAVPADFPPLDADPVRLNQVLGNLLSNAIRHTKSGGTIVVEACREGDEAHVVVRDDGEGIDPADLPKVFDRFYRAEPSRNRASGGSGLGLAIARRLTEAHGGRIAIESEPGHGAAVSLAWPIHRPAG